MLSLTQILAPGFLDVAHLEIVTAGPRPFVADLGLCPATRGPSTQALEPTLFRAGARQDSSWRHSWLDFPGSGVPN